MVFLLRPLVVRRERRGNPQPGYSHVSALRLSGDAVKRTDRAQEQDEEQRKDVRRCVVPTPVSRATFRLLIVAVVLSSSQFGEEEIRRYRCPGRLVPLGGCIG